MKQKGLSPIESPFFIAETQTTLTYSVHRNDWKQNERFFRLHKY
ncbi:hypothetical protein [Bacillus zhangzhouensis]|nr:hypothetical protein [Bacillus zhangzhouensis]